MYDACSGILWQKAMLKQNCYYFSGRRSMRKVLILAYYYPPMGGAGVQRIAKFVKYLPDYGYIPVVVAGPSEENIPNDGTLVGDVESATTYRVELTEREERLRQFCLNKFIRRIPGIPFKWWVSAAKRVCQEAVQTEEPDVICATVSPFLGVRAVEAVGKRYGIPWVVDMRDPWAIDPLTFYSTWFHYRIELAAMRDACYHANGVIMNTPHALDAVKKKFPELDSKKLFCITNGWDKEDLKIRIKPEAGQNSSKPLTIVHIGGFLTRAAILMDPISRKLLGIKGNRLLDFIKYSSGKSNLLARSLYYLLQALRLLLSSGQISENDLRIILVGDPRPEDKNLVAMLNFEKMVEFTGYVSHKKCIQSLSSADIALLAIHKPQNGCPPLTIPGKTYEYMGLKKPILALVPPGSARHFMIRSGLGTICDPTDVNHIAQTLLVLIEKHRDRTLNVKPDDQFINQFERRKLTEKLAEVLDFAISQHHSKNAD